MTYEYLISPFEFDGFDSISKKQADEYFKWYTAQSFKRIELLSEYVSKTSDKYIFDYTPQSLIALWEWYEQNVLKDIEKDTSLPVSVLKVALDISFYFAELFIKNNPSIKWGYFTRPKSRMSVNKPVLLGFTKDTDLDPRLIVENCSYRSIQEKNPNHLYNIYINWLESI